MSRRRPARKARRTSFDVLNHVAAGGVFLMALAIAIFIGVGVAHMGAVS